MATRASRIALAGSNISSTGEVDADLLDNTDSSAFLSLDGNGRLGIGTASPDRALTIEGSDFPSSAIRLKRTDVGANNDAGLQFESAAGANADTGMGGIWFQNSLDGNAYALIRARTDDATGTSGRLDFMTGTSSVGNSTTPRMTIKGDGNVGIGTTSPVYKLHVNSGATNVVADFESTDGIAGIRLRDNSGNVELSASGNDFRVQPAGGTAEFIVKNGGNVGIGTTNPGAKLSVSGPAALANLGGGSTGSSALYVNSTSGHVGELIQVLKNGATKMHMANDGKLGIGTNDPKKLLHLYGDENTGGLGIVIQDDGWGAPNGLFMTTVRNSDGAYTIRKNTATAMDFSTYTDMLSVEGNGHVGIGTANASYRLDVQGGKVRHRGATQTGSGNLVFPNNTNFQTYAQENGFQIAAESSGDWASHLILTNVPASGTNKHWVIHHAPITNNTSYKQDSLVFTFQNTSAVDQIGGDGAGNTALALQSNGSVKVNGSAVGENFGVNGRAKFHGSDYQQIKLQSGSNQGFAGIQFSDIFSASDGNNGLSDTSQLGFLRFSHGDGMNQTISGQSANAGYVFGSSENVNVISFQHNMSTTGYGTNAGEIRFGTGVSTTYSTSSDRRIKENIATLASGSSKTKILAMNPVTYNLINDPNETPVEHTGFIAQEMHEIMPEIVQGHGSTDRETGEDTIMSIDYSKLTPVLVGALQDALAEIETLKARLDEAGL